VSIGEKNKALVCRFLEAQSTGDLEALDELLAPDFVDHGLLPGQDPGREGFMQGVAEAHAAPHPSAPPSSTREPKATTW
jgi:ketosteroid isomerase-like protein